MSSFAINRVNLLGRLTRDPELRPLSSGHNVCGLRIACNSARRDEHGEYQERPNYFDVNVFGPSAENANRYTKKGSRVAIDGRLEWREWESADGQKRQAVSVVSETIVFLDGPGESDGREAGNADPKDEIDAMSAGELVGVGAGAEEDDLGW
jgi:single-strand DNA-binding protein